MHVYYALLPAGVVVVESSEIMCRSDIFSRCSSYFVENKLGCRAVTGVANQTLSEKHYISAPSARHQK
ncbi:Sex-determining region Y protein [Dirofilaria immitis]